LDDIESPLITWADYDVKPYPDGTFTTEGAAYARQAVRFERRLELALEGHRLFDLRRWDDMDPGYAASVLNAFTSDVERGYYAEAVPYAAKHRWFPLPTQQVQLSIVNGEPTLEQNEGW
jgi:hypothetical protein